MRLTMDEMAIVAEHFPKAGGNPLGFFANVKGLPGEKRGAAEASLGEKGVLRDGALVGTAGDLLGVLADPEQCTRLVLRTETLVVEKYSYKKGDVKVLLENQMGELAVGAAGDFTGALMEVAQMVGMSDIKGVEVAGAFRKPELMVVLAMVDVVRMRAMAGYWGAAGTDAASGAVSFEAAGEIISLGEIQQLLDAPMKNTFVKMMAANYNFSGPEGGAGGLRKTLKQLEEGGLVSPAPGMQDTWILAEAYTLLGRSFLVTQSVTILETVARKADGSLLSSGTLFVNAGIHDILVFLFDAEEVQISTLSCRAMLDMIKYYLECPEL